MAWAAWFRQALVAAPVVTSALLSASALAAEPGPVVQTEQVRAELLAHAPEGLGPAKPMWLALQLRHIPHWHTYWKNPGDSGLPTTFAWTLPAGATAGEIAWPAPQRLTVGPLVNYGYEGTLLLAAPLQLPAGWSGSALAVKLKADWLVCADTCIPQSGEFALNVPATPQAGHAAAFQQALAAVPRPAGQASAKVVGDELQVQASGLPQAWRALQPAVFIGQAGVIEHATKATLSWSGDTLSVRQPLSAQRSESPAAVEFVLTAPGQPALALTAPVRGGWPSAAAGAAAAAAPATAAPATAAPTAAPAGTIAGADSSRPATATSAAGAGLPLLTLLLAFAGGLLLNLMPCVFPVLSLKVLGLAGHGGERRALLAGGLAYTGGVLVSFLALAGLLLMLRAGGAELGWGFQLQSPLFVAGLAVLFTLIGLNLSGVIGLAGVMPDRVCNARASRPLVDHALTGVLAVLIASPCTAPFMGAALGIALTQPALSALAVFAALGLGMAAPYLLVSAWPRLAHRLPRPGAWMERFKLLLAFPMYATVVWLLWVLGHQVGIDGAAAVLGLLVALAFLAWVWGPAGFGRRTRAALGLAGAALLALGTLAAWPLLRLPADAPLADAGAAPTGTGATTVKGPAQGGGEPTRTAVAPGTWQAWSPERVAQAQAEGRPVLVDFTAAWCVTCQFNKHGTLANRALLADLHARQVLLLRADWTRRDATITQALTALGRSGVPVYALYAPGQAAPQLLPELLTVSAVREAIARWPASP